MKLQMSNSKHGLRALLAVVALMLSPALFASGATDSTPAVSGYDVVSYFTKQKAERGSEKHAVTYQDSTYWFTSAEHKALFSQQPQRYLPQYDGYCAYGIRYGQMVEADPQAWIIVDDKLYLHTDHSFLEKWQADTGAAIKEGDEQWQVLREK